MILLRTQIAVYGESCGARTLGSFRGSLQAQCKAFLDSQHSRCTMQLQHLLEVRPTASTHTHCFTTVSNRHQLPPTAVFVIPPPQSEQWTMVEVPASFQQIVDRLLSRWVGGERRRLSTLIACREHALDLSAGNSIHSMDAPFQSTGVVRVRP